MTSLFSAVVGVFAGEHGEAGGYFDEAGYQRAGLMGHCAGFGAAGDGGVSRLVELGNFIAASAKYVHDGEDG
jgi:hypothetical protein